MDPTRIERALGGGRHRRVTGSDAHGDHIEFPTGGKLYRHQRTGEPREHLAAQHGASVVDERQHNGLAAEGWAQGDSVAGFVAECGIKRKLLVQTLVKTEVAQHLSTSILRAISDVRGR